MQRGGEELREHRDGEGGGEVGVSVRHAVLCHQLVPDRVLYCGVQGVVRVVMDMVCVRDVWMDVTPACLP